MLANSLQSLCVQAKTREGGGEYIVPARVFGHILRAALRNVALDEAYYLHRYRDVAEAIGRGAVKSAKEHAFDPDLSLVEIE